MTAWRKPQAIYRIDVLGALVLAALGLAAWWLVAAPWQQTWRSYRELATQRAAAQSELEANTIESECVQQKLAWLETVVATETGRVPRADSLPALLREMTEIAQETHVELLSVAPQPITNEGAYALSDIHVVARAGSHNFIRFLDRLAQKNPHQCLRTCSLAHPADRPQPTCEISCTIGFYMLPASTRADQRGEP